jgi:hypothetical protein
MAIENCEERIAVAEVESVDTCIFHGFSPALMDGLLPCISAETYEYFVPFPSLVFFYLLGSER